MSHHPNKINMKVIYNMKCMMKYIKSAAVEASVWVQNQGDWTSALTMWMYETIHRGLKIPSSWNRLYKRILWKTYLNMVKKNKGILQLPTQPL